MFKEKEKTSHGDVHIVETSLLLFAPYHLQLPSILRDEVVFTTVRRRDDASTLHLEPLHLERTHTKRCLWNYPYILCVDIRPHRRSIQLRKTGTRKTSGQQDQRDCKTFPLVLSFQPQPHKPSGWKIRPVRRHGGRLWWCRSVWTGGTLTYHRGQGDLSGFV